MVVLCERCRTRFQLDDSRIPTRGIRVRCSRCKHAFFLRPAAEPSVPKPPPGPDSKEPADPEFGRPEAGPEGEEPPGPSFAPPPSALDDAEMPAPDAARGNFESDESDWEFNTDFSVAAGEDTDGARAEPSGAEEEASAESGRLSFADVGDPENWDLLAEEDLIVSPVETAPDPRPPPAPERQAPVPPESGRTARRTQPAPPPAAPVRSAPARTPSPVGELLGWIATALLLVVAAHGSLRVSAQTRPASAAEALAGLQVEELHGRWVENALGGTLYVVSGRLRNTTTESRSLESLLMVSLLRDSGASIAGLRAPAGRALPPRRLRQDAPERLREELGHGARALAREPLAPGEALEFDALFETISPEARRMRVETAPLPARAGRAAREAEPGDPDPRAEGELTSSTTSSLPPEALPSSE